jgi:hypothetical protein
MSEEIQFDGKPYISAQDAAREIGLSGDYVARLARTGRLPARRVAGGAWFVEHEAANRYRIKGFKGRTAPVITDVSKSPLDRRPFGGAQYVLISLRPS